MSSKSSSSDSDSDSSSSSSSSSNANNNAVKEIKQTKEMNEEEMKEIKKSPQPAKKESAKKVEESDDSDESESESDSESEDSDEKRAAKKKKSSSSAKQQTSPKVSKKTSSPDVPKKKSSDENDNSKSPKTSSKKKSSSDLKDSKSDGKKKKSSSDLKSSKKESKSSIKESTKSTSDLKDSKKDSKSNVKSSSKKNLSESKKGSEKKIKKGSTFKNKLRATNESIDNSVLERARQKDLYPIQLKFEDLSYSVPIKPKKKQDGNVEAVEKYKKLLHNLYGTFQPGTLTAIMGSSGAGKTTLLNVLAGRVSTGKITGNVLLNGTERDDVSKSLMKHQAYVMQDDILMNTLTPREIITFSALLRIPNAFSDEQKQKRIEGIIDELNIRKCENTQVGAPGLKRGISGGERKRVSVGVELVTNPSLLFLDEPTSGLDSFTAHQVVESLQNLAKSGRTVICTIHQPNSQIFQLFDNLILLAKGHMVYNGPTADAVTYFASINYPTPSFTNPADWFMDILHIDPNDAASDQRVNYLIESYRKSDMQSTQQEIKATKLEFQEQEKDHHGYAQGWATQVKLCTQRAYKDFIREPLKIRAMLGQTIFLSILMGLIYLQLKDNIDDIQSKMGSLFFVCVSLAMNSVMAVVNTFPGERALFMREVGARMYRTSAWYVSKMFIETPFLILLPLIMSSITYWMIGFQADAAKFFIFVLILVLVTNIGSAMGMLLGVLARDSGVAVALVPVTIIPFILFSGFLVTVGGCPDWFIWMIYISFARWSFQALVLNEFTDLTITCSKDQEINGVCRTSNGNQVISDYGLDDAGSILDCVLVLIGLWVGLRIVGFLALMWKARGKINA
eukprot:CAMPEP_0168555874 /NCGR_PEP_ID=MMETSP0413-20121227/8573_1 /TAXON_ID=136452 /ORGANISM="Filamoeba nolandi, Strain NC-AS-23-1" /LENGTH=847 /DNA_ID=CAMNT_0008586765 /DNA_START=41 /DNA_END=2584 /DNA_ORIENTATION=-